jgi:hypothetical protein
VAQSTSSRRRAGYSSPPVRWILDGDLEGGDSVNVDLGYDGDAAAEYHERRAIEREHLFRSADHEQMRRRIATLESQVRNLTEVVNTLIDVVVTKNAAP